MVISSKVCITGDTSLKYGHNQAMIVANQPILAGEVVSACSCSDQDMILSRDTLLQIMQKDDSMASLFIRYSCMVKFNESV